MEYERKRKEERTRRKNIKKNKFKIATGSDANSFM